MKKGENNKLLKKFLEVEENIRMNEFLLVVILNRVCNVK